MLTEANRKDLIEDLQRNLRFDFQGYSPPLNVYRYGEGFDRNQPYILVEFLPSNRAKFRSISDIIGPATPLGEYKQYGYCQIENCIIYCYCGEFPKEFSLNGRFFTEAMATTTLRWVQRNWEQLLWKMYASWDRGEDMFAIYDESYYDPDTATQVYCYRISLYIRTQVRWDKIPERFAGEELVNIIGTYGKSTNEEEYRLIKRIEYSES
jgi:hypothetical protein